MNNPMIEPHYEPDGTPRVGLLPRDSLSLALCLVFLLGLLLRMLDLGGQSLWVDELLTLRQGQVPGYSLWIQFLDDSQAALPMVLATTMSRVSENETWLRLPSALLGAMSIPLIFEIVRRFATDRAALIAALLLAVNPMHIEHSQEVRGYSFMVFFGLAATLTVLDGGRRPAFRQQAMLVLTGVAAGLSNMQGMLWMGGLALGLAVSGRLRPRDFVYWLLPFALIVFLLAPWWTTMFQVHETSRLLPGVETGEDLRGGTTWTPWALPWAGFVLSFGSMLGPTVTELHMGPAPTAGLIAIASLAALLVLILGVAGIRRMGHRAVEPLMWSLPVIVVTVFLAVRNVKPFNPRYVLAALPVLLMFLAVGLDGMRVGVARALLAAWIGLTGVSLGRYYFDADYRHADVRAAAAFVQEREGDDDVVLVPTVKMVFDFYQRGSSPTATLQPGLLANNTDPGVLIGNVAPGRRFIWYVRARSWVHDPEGRLDDWFESNYRRVSRTRLDGVVVSLYDRGKVQENSND
jgi:mannosyltransferase